MRLRRMERRKLHTTRKGESQTGHSDARSPRSRGRRGRSRRQSRGQNPCHPGEEARSTETMSFKDIVKRDIRAVFMNTEEFAERRSVKYGGQTYRDIPVVLEGPQEEKRIRLSDDHVQGLHLVTAVLYCAAEDLGGVLPEQGRTLEISTQEGGTFFRKYGVAAAVCDMGMFHIELEAVRQ